MPTLLSLHGLGRSSGWLLAVLVTAPGFAQQAPATPSTTAEPRGLERGELAGDCLVPIHTADADLGVPYGVWAAGSRYKASFHDGATLVPFLGPQYPHNLPLTWRTTSVRVGEAELVTQAPRLTYAGLRAEYDLGGLTEAYDVRSEGIEQTFVLSQRPPTNGDLVIHGVVESMLHAADVGAGHQALQFCDEAGKPLVSFGAATAVDARGATQAMTTSYEHGHVTLRLDAAWLATAVFPLVVDPLLGPGQTVTGAARKEVDVVRESENSHDAVWVAYSVVVSASDNDVYLRRWNDDGTLSVSAYNDVTASWSSSDPHCAYVGGADRAVVVFDRFFPQTSVRLLRYHSHDRTDLTSNTDYDVIASTDNAWRADVGGTDLDYSGSRALVVWQQEANGGGAFQETSGSDIFGCTIDLLAGTASAPFAIADAALTDNERPSVNQTSQGLPNSYWCVAYQTISPFSIGPPDDWDIAVRAVTMNGGVSPALLIDNSSPDHKLAPIIEGNGSRFLVAFTSSTLAQQPGQPSGVNGHQIRVARVHWSASGSAGSQQYGTVLLQSNVDARLELGGLGFDRETVSHWALMFRSTATDILYLRTVGFQGQQLQAETVVNPAGTAVSVRGGVSFDATGSQFMLAYGVNGANNYVTVDRFVFPTVTPWSTSGASCGPAVIAWEGSQQIGDEAGYLDVSGAAIDSIHLLVLASATASVQIVGVPPIVDGCWLLVPTVGPDYLGLLDLRIGAGALWNVPLPEFLSPYTFYFQDFHTVGGGSFSLLSTQRLNLPIVK